MSNILKYDYVVIGGGSGRRIAERLRIRWFG